MHIKYNTEKLNSIIKNISDLLGISVIVFDCEGNKLIQYSNSHDYCSYLQRNEDYKKKCLLSDMSLVEKCKKTKMIETHLCHAGLCDLAMPIIKDDILAAYIIVGRIRLSDSSSESKYIFSDINANDLYNNVTTFSENQLENLTKLLPNIMFDTVITFENNQISENIAQYIRNNLTDDLSINALCNRFYISKNVIYKSFSDTYNCTVNKFVTSARLEKSKELLTNTKLPVIQISECVGFTYTYFCRLFKKHFSLSPAKYRRLYKE